jgi:hypothetical protein
LLALPSLDPRVVLDGLHARDAAGDLDRSVDVRLRPDKPLNWTTPLNVSTLISLTFRLESLKIAAFTLP